MSTSTEDTARARAIISLVEKASIVPEDPQFMQDAEEVSGLTDGTFSFDEVAERAVKRHIRAESATSAATDFLNGSRKRINLPQWDFVRVFLSSITKQTTGAGQILSQSLLRRPVVSFGLLATAAGAMLVIGVSFFARRDRTGAPPPQRAAETPKVAVTATAAEPIVLRWPEQQSEIAKGHHHWISKPPELARHLPDYDRVMGSMLGAASISSDFDESKLSTVIVRSEDGWGSGAMISGDGWLLTNYHVVAEAAQVAAIRGKPAKLQIITARIVQERTEPNPAVSATLYRADPVHDLALLKLDSPSSGESSPYFRLAEEAKIGEECYVIGSQKNGLAWWVRQGTVSREFDYPEDLSQFAAGASSAGVGLERDRATVLVTDTRISSGDSGGPLLNSKHELIGLTFATPANRTAGSVGWHIALRHLRSFTAHLPSKPELVPFDPWNAGLPEASTLEPERIAPRAILYSYTQAGQDSSVHPVAITIFADLTGQSPASHQDSSDVVPHGLWGMESRGTFRFTVMVTLRRDNVVAVGYTDEHGVVTDIRIGVSGQPLAKVNWARAASGRWTSSVGTGQPLIEKSRLPDAGEERLKQLLVSFGAMQQSAHNTPEHRGPAPNRKQKFAEQ